MALTIGRHWKRPPKGDFQSECAYCGVRWRRSELTRDSAGLLRCPDEGDGHDSTALSALNAEAYRMSSLEQMDGPAKGEPKTYEPAAALYDGNPFQFFGSVTPEFFYRADRSEMIVGGGSQVGRLFDIVTPNGVLQRGTVHRARITRSAELGGRPALICSGYQFWLRQPVESAQSGYAIFTPSLIWAVVKINKHQPGALLFTGSSQARMGINMSVFENHLAMQNNAAAPEIGEFNRVPYSAGQWMVAIARFSNSSADYLQINDTRVTGGNSGSGLGNRSFPQVGFSPVDYDFEFAEHGAASGAVTDAEVANFLAATREYYGL